MSCRWWAARVWTEGLTFYVSNYPVLQLRCVGTVQNRNRALQDRLEGHSGVSAGAVLPGGRLWRRRQASLQEKGREHQNFFFGPEGTMCCPRVCGFVHVTVGALGTVRQRAENSTGPCARRGWEPRLSCKLWTGSQTCPGGAVGAGTALGPAGTAQIVKAIWGSAMCSQTSDIWEVLP